jgi:hypothetical protein
VADLNERGQIILVAAFALGVIFIALAVVVNTAIFTENLATRSESTDGSDALEYRHEVEQSVEDILESVNNNDGDAGSFETNVSDFNSQGAFWQASDGRIVTVGSLSTVDGERFSNSTGTFVNESGNTSWNLTTDIEDSRAIRINITDHSELENSEADGFRLGLQNSNDRDEYWNLTVWADSGASGDVVNITVREPGGNTDTCSTTRSEPVIDVTDGTLAGEPCGALRFDGDTEMWYGSGLNDQYRIQFFRADEINGSYEGVVEDGGASSEHTPSDIDSVIYSGTVRYTYETNSVKYETNVTAAPGEPPS